MTDYVLSVEFERMVSTADDIDTRTGRVRYLRDDYDLHADHIDTIRVAMAWSSRSMLGYLNSPEDRANADYWAGEMWNLERAMRALGIATDA